MLSRKFFFYRPDKRESLCDCVAVPLAAFVCVGWCVGAECGELRRNRHGRTCVGLQTLPAAQTRTVVAYVTALPRVGEAIRFSFFFALCVRLPVRGRKKKKAAAVGVFQKERDASLSGGHGRHRDSAFPHRRTHALR